jgi:hypothetical protein
MSELFPTKNIAIEYVNCTDPAREYEFNRWYNKILIPELSGYSGITGVYRYRNLAKELREGQARYFTLYRITSTDPWDLMQKVQEDNRKRFDQGFMIDCLKSLQTTVWDFLDYRHTISQLQQPLMYLPDGMPEAMLVVPTICTDPKREEEFNDWYLNTHFHDLLETSGLVQAHRYRNLNPTPGSEDAQYLALYEINSDDPATVVRRILEDDRNIRIPHGRMINCIKAVLGFGTWQHFDKL